MNGRDIAFVNETYGYGQFRYSPSKNAINGSPEFKPFSGTGYAPFYRLQGVQLEYMFQVGQDERKSYYSDSTGRKAISDKERAAYFRDIINFKWASL